MRRTYLAWSVKLLSVLAFAGCAPPNVEPTARELAESVCELSFRCCDRGEIDYYLGPFVTDEADCAERLVTSAGTATTVLLGIEALGGSVNLPNLEALEEAIESGRVRVDQDAVAECATLIRTAMCNEPPAEPPPPIEGCNPAIPEPLPEGTACDRIVVGLGREGATCYSGMGSLECAEGFVCLRSVPELGLVSACGEPQQEGEACFHDEECAQDLYCSLADGRCRVPMPLMQTCSYSDPSDLSPSPDTLLVRCEPNLTCSPFGETCVGPCARGSLCVADIHCDEDAGLFCMDGFCDTPRSAGQPCQIDEHCQPGLTCDPDPLREGLFCTPLFGDGAPCFQDDECLSGYCDTTVCAPKKANNQPCATLDHNSCLSGFCSPTATTCQPQVAPPGACPTGLNEQCMNGRCSLATGNCVALLSDGMVCLSGNDCLSDMCIGGRCGTRPVADGQPCDSAIDCESNFCSLETSPGTCESPPLPNGRLCTADDQCESGVCFLASGATDATCRTGAGAGSPCNAIGVLPCDPANFFCDVEAEIPVCTAFRETGANCSRDIECRGACVTEWGRRMCSAAARPGALVCDAI